MGNVLKADKIEFGDSLKLDARTSQKPQPQRPPGPQTQSGPAQPANAVVVEQTQTHTVLEFTCGCGQKTYIKCNHQVGG